MQWDKASSQLAERGQKSEVRGQLRLRLEERFALGWRQKTFPFNNLLPQTSNAKLGPCALNQMPRFSHDEPLWIHNCIYHGSDSGLDDAGDLLSSERRASRGN